MLACLIHKNAERHMETDLVRKQTQLDTDSRGLTLGESDPDRDAGLSSIFFLPTLGSKNLTRVAQDQATRCLCSVPIRRLGQSQSLNPIRSGSLDKVAPSSRTLILPCAYFTILSEASKQAEHCRLEMSLGPSHGEPQACRAAGT